MRSSSLAGLALVAFVACSKSEQPKPVETAKSVEAVKPVEPVKPVETATKTAEKPAEKPAEPVAAAVAGGTGVSGVISFEGTPPPPRPVDMSTKKECLKANPKPTEQDVLVKDGKLEGVLVYVKSGLPAGTKYEPRTDTVELDQKGCLYLPKVVGVQVGQPFDLVNSDAFVHNVHALAKGADGFNQAMPKPMKLTKKFKKAQGVIDVKCDVHAWMLAHVGVFDHPYFAVTGADGKFAIEKLPAGSYELAMWHPTLGDQTAAVVVKDGAGSVVNATFKNAK